MKTFKKALLGLALATCAAVNAYADPVYTYTDSVFVYADTSNPGTLVDWVFGEGSSGIQAGGTFSYDFLFNMPPSAPTTSFVFQVLPDVLRQVYFDSISFSYSTGTVVDGYTLINAGNALQGAGWLDSGVYDLNLTGTYLADGASFTGIALDDVTDLSSLVPEPMSLALVGLGLLGMTGMRRRKTISAA